MATGEVDSLMIMFLHSTSSWLEKIPRARRHTTSSRAASLVSFIHFGVRENKSRLHILLCLMLSIVNSH